MIQYITLAFPTVTPLFCHLARRLVGMDDNEAMAWGLKTSTTPWGTLLLLQHLRQPPIQPCIDTQKYTKDLRHIKTMVKTCVIKWLYMCSTKRYKKNDLLVHPNQYAALECSCLERCNVQVRRRIDEVYLEWLIPYLLKTSDLAPRGRPSPELSFKCRLMRASHVIIRVGP